METRDLRAIFAERKARLLATLDELRAPQRAAIEAIIEEADRRLAGDTSALGDKRACANRVGAAVAAVIEDVLMRSGARANVLFGTAQWQDRKSDILRALEQVSKPTRHARRLVAAAVTYRDWPTVEILTSPHSRVFLASLDVDLRAVQVDAVRALSEQMGNVPGVAFVLAQESDCALAELVAWACMLVPVFP